jgi:Tfp pilus assembly protein PilO
MARNFNLGQMKLTGASIKDPRVAMRAVIAVLLAANVAAAVLAFKPFGGSAADLRLEQTALGTQIAGLEKSAAAARLMVDKVEKARREGDGFLAKYVVERRTMSSALAEELNRMAKDAGVRALPGQLQLDPIEGSDTLEMASMTVGYEGPYESLKKFVEMVDKSPRFLIIENMTVVSPQQLQQKGQNPTQNVNVALKLDTFVRETQGATP